MIPAVCAPIKKQLDEANAAYHDLMTGQAVKVLVDQNGERVEYQTSTRNQLAAYIEQLQQQLEDCLAGKVTTRAKGPLRFFF